MGRTCTSVHSALIALLVGPIPGDPRGASPPAGPEHRPRFRAAAGKTSDWGQNVRSSHRKGAPLCLCRSHCDEFRVRERQMLGNVHKDGNDTWICVSETTAEGRAPLEMRQTPLTWRLAASPSSPRGPLRRRLLPRGSAVRDFPGKMTRAASLRGQCACRDEVTPTPCQLPMSRNQNGWAGVCSPRCTWVGRPGAAAAQGPLTGGPAPRPLLAGESQAPAEHSSHSVRGQQCLK